MTGGDGRVGGGTMTRVYFPAYLQKKEGGFFVSADSLSFQSDDGILSREWQWTHVTRITANKAGTSSKNLLRIDVDTSASRATASTSTSTSAGEEEEGNPNTNKLPANTTKKVNVNVLEFESRDVLEEAKEDCLKRMEIISPSVVRPTTATRRSQEAAKQKTVMPSKMTPETKTTPTKAKAKPKLKRPTKNHHNDDDDDVQFVPTEAELHSPQRRTVQQVNVPDKPKVILPIDPNSYHSADMEADMHMQMQKEEEDDDDDDTEDNNSNATPKHQTHVRRQEYHQDVQFTPTKSEQESPSRRIEHQQSHPVKWIPNLDLPIDPNSQSSAAQVAKLPFGGAGSENSNSSNESESAASKDFISSSGSSSSEESEGDREAKKSFDDNAPAKRRHVHNKSPIILPKNEQRRAVKQTSQTNTKTVNNSPLSDATITTNFTKQQVTTLGGTDEECQAAEDIECTSGNSNRDRETHDKEEVGIIQPCQGCHLEYILGAIGVTICLILTPIIVWIMIRQLHKGDDNDNGNASGSGNNNDEYYNIDSDGPLIFY